MLPFVPVSHVLTGVGGGGKGPPLFPYPEGPRLFQTSVADNRCANRFTIAGFGVFNPHDFVQPIFQKRSDKLGFRDSEHF